MKQKFLQKYHWVHFCIGYLLQGMVCILNHLEKIIFFLCKWVSTGGSFFARNGSSCLVPPLSTGIPSDLDTQSHIATVSVDSCVPQSCLAERHVCLWLSIPSGSCYLSVSFSAYFPESRDTGFDEDIPSGTEYYKVSCLLLFSLCLIVGLCISSHIPQKEASLIMAEWDTYPWV